MIPDRLKILVLGGYGTFDGRLIQLLADEERLTMFVAGRSVERASAFCQTLKARAQLIPVKFDRNESVEFQIAAIGPDIVVDASGPFQSYGDDPYRVVKACVARGVHYLDLADGSAFVNGVTQFDDDARTQKTVVLSGVSSFPVLTAAVVRHLSGDFAKVETVVGGIAPSPYAGVGLNVIRAISAYAGKKIALMRNGRAASGYGLTEICRYTIAPPGRIPLHSTRFSLVDVPDLTLIPALWPGLQSIWMGAGPVPEILHRALNGLARLVRIGLLPSLSPFAQLFHWVINVLRWGEHRGGMFVCVEGQGMDGRWLKRSWHLLAEGSDGPFIPSMAVEGLIRRWLSGGIPDVGARPAVNALELADYEKLFSPRQIHFGCRTDTSPDLPVPLYKKLLGDAWEKLPPPIRAIHDGTGTWHARGKAKVERGRNILARCIAAIFGFPKAADDVPVQVRFESRDGEEIWHRTFADRSFASRQKEGVGRSERLLCERFGPFCFAIALVLDRDRLRLIVRRWSFLGLPLPASIAPQGDAYESVELERFNFHVEIALPLIGLVVCYRGWLVPAVQ